MRLKVNRILNPKEEEDKASGLSTNDEKDLLRIDDRLVALDKLPAGHVPIGAQWVRRLLKSVLNDGNDAEVIELREWLSLADCSKKADWEAFGNKLF
jgi:hypothetical protein